MKKNTDPTHPAPLAIDSENHRETALDGVRGLASLAVVLYHFTLVSGLRDMPGKAKWLGKLFSVGWIGVDVFFVLSGFLITSILAAKKDSLHFKRAFYARRLFRVVPLYFVFLVLYLTLVPRLLAAHPQTAALAESIKLARSRQGWLWTYTANLWMALRNQGIGGALEPVWSLCVEIQFYLLWPFLIRLLPAQTLKKAIVACLLALPACRLGLLLVGVHPRTIYFLTITRMDPILVGTFLALLRQDHASYERWRSVSGQLLALAIAALGILFLLGRGINEQSKITVILGYSVLAACSGCFVLAAFTGSQTPLFRRVLAFAPFRSAGKHSYAIYLYNLPAFLIATAWLKGKPLPIFATAFTAVLILAGASWVLIEKPCLGLRRAFPWNPRPKE